MSVQEKPNLTIFILLSVLALPLVGAGIIGLSAPELLPWAGKPSVAWSLLGVGIIIDGAAVINLLAELRRVRER